MFETSAVIPFLRALVFRTVNDGRKPLSFRNRESALHPVCQEALDDGVVFGRSLGQAQNGLAAGVVDAERDGHEVAADLNAVHHEDGPRPVSQRPLQKRIGGLLRGLVADSPRHTTSVPKRLAWRRRHLGRFGRWSLALPGRSSYGPAD